VYTKAYPYYKAETTVNAAACKTACIAVTTDSKGAELCKGFLEPASGKCRLFDWGINDLIPDTGTRTVGNKVQGLSSSSDAAVKCSVIDKTTTELCADGLTVKNTALTGGIVGMNFFLGTGSQKIDFTSLFT